MGKTWSGRAWLGVCLAVAMVGCNGGGSGGSSDPSATTGGPASQATTTQSSSTDAGDGPFDTVGPDDDPSTEVYEMKTSNGTDYQIDRSGNVFVRDEVEGDYEEIQAKLKELFGDELPRVVDDAEIRWDMAAQTMHVGGLTFAGPWFGQEYFESLRETEISKSTTLNRTTPVLDFLQVRLADPEWVERKKEEIGTPTVKIGFGVFTQTTWMTRPEARADAFEGQFAILNMPNKVYSGTVGDWHTGVQCWVEVRSEARPDPVAQVVIGFAGIEIASSLVEFTDPFAFFGVPTGKELAESMISQACGELPEGFADVEFV